MPLQNQLTTALESHRYAIQLDPRNANALFNLAQVLSCLYDELPESTEGLEASIGILQEAVSHLNSCLTLQEEGFGRQQAELKATAQDAAEEAIEQVPSRPDTPSSADEAWATIEEPITSSTLLETGRELLEVLIDLCGLLADSKRDGLQDIEFQAEELMRRLGFYVENAEQNAREELFLTHARFESAKLEAAFTTGIIDLPVYDSRLKGAFENLASEEEATVLYQYAVSLVDLVRATDRTPGSTQLHWNRLTRALDMLATATQRPRLGDLFAVHALRGDIELMRLRLSTVGDLPANLKSDSVRNTLLDNAEKYYRGAIGLSRTSSSSVDQDAIDLTLIKEALVSCIIHGNTQAMQELSSQSVASTKIVGALKEAVDDLLLSELALTHSGLAPLLRDDN